MNFAENLRVLREKNGMTQEQLAERMEVSRQTISKWESGGSFPEMEKTLQLTELFGCTMDGLMKGNLEKTAQKEAESYETHGNWVSKNVAAGVAFCIAGLAMECLSAWALPFTLGESGMLFFLFVLIGVVLFVRVGIQSGHFHKKHPYVEPFYTEEENESFHKKYSTVMTSGIGGIIGSLAIAAGMGKMPMFQGNRGEGFTGFIFFTIIAVSVTAIVYIALQASKYNIEEYNSDNLWENSEEGKTNGRLIGKVCGIVMTAATALYIGTSAMTDGWDRFWWFFAVGGVLCGVAAIFLNKRRD